MPNAPSRGQGLTAAAGLARAGQRVLVLEQHFVVGGNAQTFRRHREYDFDVGIHALDDCGPDGTIPRILRDLGAEVGFAPLDPDGFDVLRFADRELRVPLGWEPYRQRLKQTFGTPQSEAATSVPPSSALVPSRCGASSAEGRRGDL